MNQYDALIVGGRAAGASLAALLARQGRRVLVVDRDEFPSDTMSTHFMSLPAVGALKRLGVLNDILAAGFRRITRHRTWIDDCCFHGIEPRAEATLELWFGGDQIGFLFPMREGEDCIALEIQPEEFDEFRSGHAAFFEAQVRKLPEMARRARNAHLEGKVIGVKGI